jgi:hypothetical protein
MIFISYYTKNTPYESVMKEYLLPSLKKWKLKYVINAVDDLGNWGANTSYKAKFILDTLQECKEDIVFLDSDATIERYPKLFFDLDPKYDVALHYLDWYLHWRKTPNLPKRELLSGTMLFRYNEKVLDLARKYVQTCKRFPNVWEQRVLEQLLPKCRTIKVYNLPATYCAVILHNNELPKYINNPVIIHHQVSRQFKRRKK